MSSKERRKDIFTAITSYQVLLMNLMKKILIKNRYITLEKPKKLSVKILSFDKTFPIKALFFHRLA